MTLLTESNNIGDVVVMEGDKRYSRETVTILSGEGELEAGAVLGEVTATPGTYAHSPAASTTGKEGAETASAILLEEVDATSEAVEAVALVRFSVVNRAGLNFEATIDTEAERDALVDDLKAAGIIARTGA